jgi:hypothetical protein
MLNIIWSDDAVDDVLENIDYLENTGQKEVDTWRKLMLRKAINRNLTFKPWWIQEYLRSPNHKTNYTLLSSPYLISVRF